jgi:hypothetical protein
MEMHMRPSSGLGRAPPNPPRNARPTGHWNQRVKQPGTATGRASASWRDSWLITGCPIRLPGAVQARFQDHLDVEFP